MEPVVGVNVAKGFSVVQAFSKRNEPWRKAISISHEKSGLEQLDGLLSELQAQTIHYRPNERKVLSYER